MTINSLLKKKNEIMTNSLHPIPPWVKMNEYGRNHLSNTTE